MEVEYAAGDPVAINGERLSPARIIERANEIGGRHGVGRVDLVENRYVGIKSRGVYESPGVTMLFHGHRAVEQLALDREVMHLRDSLIPRYAEMVYNGHWFAPERESLQALVDDTQKNVTGVARLKLFKGGVDRRAQVAELALRSGDRELRGGRRLRSGRRRGLHPAGRAQIARTRAARRAAAEQVEDGGEEGKPALGKVIQFKPPRTGPKLVPRVRVGECPKCGHKMDVHIAHPNGVMACAARGCTCRTQPAR